MLDLQDPSLAIRARQLAVALHDAFALSPDDDAGDALLRMHEKQFDVAPVIANGDPVGVLDALKVGCPIEPGSTVRQAMRTIDAGLLVSSEAPLSALMRRMCEEPFLYVLENTRVTGFVTPADLGTVPTRTHFYLLLAQLEAALGDYLRALYEDQSLAIEQLSPSRRENQARIAADLRSKDRFIDDLSCISLDDLVTLAGKEADFREAVNAHGVGWRTAKSGLADFRNDIMHPSRTFADSADSRPAKLVEWERRLQALIRAALSLTEELSV